MCENATRRSPARLGPSHGYGAIHGRRQKAAYRCNKQHRTQPGKQPHATSATEEPPAPATKPEGRRGCRGWRLPRSTRRAQETQAQARLDKARQSKKKHPKGPGQGCSKGRSKARARVSRAKARPGPGQRKGRGKKGKGGKEQEKMELFLKKI